MAKNKIFKAGNGALITGAALGIGRSAARFCAQKGMRLVLVDLPGEDFEKTVGDLKSEGADVLPLPVDLSDPSAALTIHDKVTEAFGPVHLLMNNAASRQGRTFDGTMEEWRQSFEVNVWSLVELTRLFEPHMIAHGERAAFVNVGSKQGITNPPGTPAYNMAKAAVKSFTEQLEHRLRTMDEADGRLSAHLLVPGWTTTGKNEHKEGAWLPEQVVERMITGVEARDFYIICPDGEVTTEMDNKRFLWAAGDITENRPPLSRWHPAHKDKAADACS